MKTETVKGFNDYTGEEALKRRKIMQIIEDTFKIYGFEPAETPIVEYEEFVRGENEKDEAVRDIFSLEDRGKRKLALRYEFTFQLKRISKNKKLPYKRYQIGYVFRDEPIKKGRTRQFIQCDIDIIGSNLKDEAEILCITKKILDTLKIKSEIYFNNRKLLNEILETEKVPEKDRENVIRALDKLDKLSEKEVADNLKEYRAEKLLKLFKNSEEFFEKYSYYKEIKELINLSKLYGINIKFSPSLARGLSYYNGSVFEIKSKELNVSICGGGSYLINNIQSTGISLGLEPLYLLSDIESDNIKYLIVSLGKDKEAITLAEKLRSKNNPTTLLLDKSPSKALEYANSYNIENIIFVGEEEVKSKKFKIKNLKTGKETILSL